MSFFNCVKILLPIVKIIKKKKSGTIYELPRPLLNFTNSLAIAIKNLIFSSLKRKDKTLVKKLTKEIVSTLKKKSLSYYNKLQIYSVAKKGKPFLHYLNFKQYRLKYTSKKAFFKKVLQKSNKNLTNFEKKNTYFKNLRTNYRENLKYFRKKYLINLKHFKKKKKKNFFILINYKKKKNKIFLKKKINLLN